MNNLKTLSRSRLLMMLVSLAVILPMMATTAVAQEYTMTLQSVAPEGTPWAAQVGRLKKVWEEKSGGRLKVKVILGRGNEEAMVRKCRKGELQAIGVSTGAMISEVPEMGVLELPFLFKDYAAADKVLDNVLFSSIEKFLAEDYGLQLYIFSENGFRNFAMKVADPSKKPELPGALGSLKMRSQDNWIHEETYKALGGNPVRVPTPEVLTSLSNKQVQGFDNTPLFAFAASWYKHVNVWVVSNHIYQPGIVVFSKKWFDGLPKDIQEIILDKDTRIKETKKGRKAIRALGKQLMGTLKKKGITIYEISGAERDAMAAKTKGVYDMFRKKAGGLGKAGKRMKKMLSIIEKNAK